MNRSSEDTQVQRFQRLVEISCDLASTLDLDALLNKIVKAAADLTKALAASIMLYDENREELYFQAATNLDVNVMRGLVVPVDSSIAGSILKTRQMVNVMDVDADPRHYSAIGEETHYKTRSLLGVPLVAKDKVVGVLEVINKAKGKFNREDEQLLSALGAQAAVAIQNARLFQQSDLISEIVHELRTPLTSIQTAAGMLDHPEVSQDQRKSLAGTIQRESSRLADMVTSFLDLATLESGRAQFKQEQVDIEELLQKVVQLMQGRLEDDHLSLRWEISSPLPSVLADPAKLEQVFINLLSNAIKYNQPGGSVTIGGSSDNQQVRIFVRDTGIGILPEHLEQLFEKFYRVPGSEEQARGTGLGLSIAKKIIDSHRGKITVESQVGTGTTFTVTLPIKP